MAVPTNTRLTFGGVQVREDLSDIIYNISPMDTPFMSGAGKGSCSNTLFEWQKDELAAAAANQKLEGDDPASLAVVEPTKLTNHTQISEKAVQTSGTAEAVDWAGRKSSQAYQLAKRAKEIKRDMELMLTGEDVKSSGGAGAARKTAALMSWLGDSVAADSNIIDGSAGTPIANDGDGTSVAAAAGADAVLTMDMVNDCVQQVWEAGGNPDIIMCEAALKVKMSALAGSVVADIVTNHDKATPAHAVNSVDVIVTDFGTFKIVPSRLCLPNTLYVLDFDFWSIDYLRPFTTETLAKTGDSVKQMMVAEYGLRGKNGQANGAVIGVKAA
jgi:hypothetical protein